MEPTGQTRVSGRDPQRQGQSKLELASTARSDAATRKSILIVDPASAHPSQPRSPSVGEPFESVQLVRIASRLGYFCRLSLRPRCHCLVSECRGWVRIQPRIRRRKTVQIHTRSRGSRRRMQVVTRHGGSQACWVSDLL